MYIYINIYFFLTPELIDSFLFIRFLILNKKRTVCGFVAKRERNTRRDIFVLQPFNPFDSFDSTRSVVRFLSLSLPLKHILSYECDQFADQMVTIIKIFLTNIKFVCNLLLCTRLLEEIQYKSVRCSPSSQRCVVRNSYNVFIGFSVNIRY